MQLIEKHRPSRLAGVVGQRATVSGLTTLLERGFNGGALAFLGQSGTGKTTTARAFCAEIGVSRDDLIECGGADCHVDFVRDLKNTFNLSTWGESGWKACIVDESHCMSPRAVQAWLPYLESLPAKRVVIFTSTEPFETDIFGNFAAPLASRCKVFTLELDQEAAAEHLAGIANDEGLNGQPIASYEKLLASCGGNIRAALQQIECGKMLTPWVDAPAAPAKPTMTGAQFVAQVAAAMSPKAPASVPGSSRIRTRSIEEELAYLAKLHPKGKKFPLCVARLTALGHEVSA